MAATYVNGVPSPQYLCPHSKCTATIWSSLLMFLGFFINFERKYDS